MARRCKDYYGECFNSIGKPPTKTLVVFLLLLLQGGNLHAQELKKSKLRRLEKLGVDLVKHPLLSSDQEVHSDFSLILKHNRKYKKNIVGGVFLGMFSAPFLYGGSKLLVEGLKSNEENAGYAQIGGILGLAIGSSTGIGSYSLFRHAGKRKRKAPKKI